MNRQQFLRRSALLSLAAAGLPRLATASPQTSDELEVTYKSAEVKLPTGKLAEVQVELVEAEFSGTKTVEPYELTLWIQLQADATAIAEYTLERKGKPSKVGEYFVASFKVTATSGDDLTGGALPKTVRLKLSPEKYLLVELQKDVFTTLPAPTECFLTSACTAARGLPDDCAELTTLRGLRDGFMRPSESGAALVEEYYRIAPAIVRGVNARDNSLAVWNLVYSDLIIPAIDLIQAGRKEEAVKMYTEYAGWMKEAFPHRKS